MLKPLLNELGRFSEVPSEVQVQSWGGASYPDNVSSKYSYFPFQVNAPICLQPAFIQSLIFIFITAYDKLASTAAGKSPLLMTALVDDAGGFRSGGVGIFRGKQLGHMAPPADRV